MDVTARRSSGSGRSRGYFVLNSYLVFILFVLLTMGQFFAVLNVTQLSDYMVKHIELIMVFFFMALLLLTLFVFVEHVRILTPLNWIVVLTVVEGVALGISRTLIKLNTESVLFCAGSAGILMLLCLCFASFSLHDFTQDGVVLSILSFICIIAAIFCVLLFVVIGEQFPLYIYSTLLLFIFCTFLVYHVQTVNGGRYAEVRKTDYLLAALMLYLDYAVLFMTAVYFIPLIFNIKFNNNDTTTTTEDPSN